MVTIVDSNEKMFQGLFDGIFKVAENPGDAGVLSNLKAAVVDHFSHEEAMYDKEGIDHDVAAHKKKHAAFLAEAGKISGPVSQEQVIFMKV